MPREHLVVVLPGIGGTQLAVPGSSWWDGAGLVWAARLKDVDLLRRPERLSLGEHEHLEPAGLVPTRKAFGLWTVVPGYDGLLQRLGKLPGAVVDDATAPAPNLDANVVAVGYDFRRSIAEAAERLDSQVRQRLDHLWPGQSHVDRVIIVAHSMGGLVARYWIAAGGGDQLCRGLVTLGTPHRGAPKALEVMANGVPVALGPLKLGHLRKPRAVLRGWPGMAELLPRYPAVEDRSKTPAQGEQGPLLYPHQLALPWLTGPATDAYAVHKRIEDGWPRSKTPTAVLPRIGYGHGTLRACSWDGARVTVTRDDPAGPELGGWSVDQGDGTVPAFSGLPLEMSRYPGLNLEVPLRHGPIAALDEIEALLDWFESHRAATAYRAGGEEPAVLGVDLPELVLAGQSLDIAATPLGVGAGTEAAIWVSVTSVPGDGDPPTAPAAEAQLEPDAGTGAYRASVTGLRPGLYEVVVAAEELAGGLETVQVVEVLDDDGLE